jgi:tetratricopeptide (TPR) repeat protein
VSIESKRKAARPPAGRQEEATLDPAVDLSADLENLKEERDFLIRSLKDLDAEHEAGDIDDSDYQSLKDDYTVRTAGVLRAIEARSAPPRRRSRPAAPAASPPAGSAPTTQGSTATSAERRRRRWRLAAVAALILAVGALAGWAVTASSGSRLPGQTATGNQQTTGTGQGGAGQSGAGQGGASQGGASRGGSIDPRIAQASQLVNKGDVAGALKLYDAVLKDDPNQPIALGNEGWLIAQAGMAANPARTDLIDAGLSRIVAAEQIDSTYTAAHFFRGYVLFRAKNDPKDAVTEFRLYLSAVDPSSPEVPEVEQLLQQAIKAAGPDVPPGPNAPGQQAGIPSAPPATSSPPSSP